MPKHLNSIDKRYDKPVQPGQKEKINKPDNLGATIFFEKLAEEIDGSAVNLYKDNEVEQNKSKTEDDFDSDLEKAFEILQKRFAETSPREYRELKEELTYTIEKLKKVELQYQTLYNGYIQIKVDRAKLQFENARLLNKLKLLEENPTAYMKIKEVDPFDEENWEENSEIEDKSKFANIREERLLNILKSKKI